MGRLNIFTEPLSYGEAAEYLKFFPSSVEDDFSTYLGGTLNVAEINLPTGSDLGGLMAWFCLKPTGEITLAFEVMGASFQYPSHPNDIARLRPFATDLIVSSALFGYRLG